MTPAPLSRGMPFATMPTAMKLTRSKSRRDPRLVAVHRGGRLIPSRHKLLTAWAADCAAHVLPLFTAVRPHDDRPRLAIEAARAWARGTGTAGASCDAAIAAHAAARAAPPGPGREAARAAGHAAATAHAADHELGAAAYAIRAVRLATTPARAAAAGRRECRWQRQRIPRGVRMLVLSDQRNRGPRLWSAFS